MIHPASVRDWVQASLIAGYLGGLAVTIRRVLRREARSPSAQPQSQTTRAPRQPKASERKRVLVGTPRDG
jgi:hypothetical protein